MPKHLIDRIPFRIALILVMLLAFGFGPDLGRDSTAAYIYAFFLIPAMVLETQLMTRIWPLALSALACSEISVRVMDIGMHFDAGFRALATTTLFGVLWVTFRNIGPIAAQAAVALLGCAVLYQFPAHSDYAVPYALGYAAGLLWLGFEQLRDLCLELRILNLRRGNKMY